MNVRWNLIRHIEIDYKLNPLEINSSSQLVGSNKNIGLGHTETSHILLLFFCFHSTADQRNLVFFQLLSDFFTCRRLIGKDHDLIEFKSFEEFLKEHELVLKV